MWHLFAKSSAKPVTSCQQTKFSVIFFFLVTSWVHYARSAATSWVIMVLHLPLWLQPLNSTIETIQYFTYYRCGQYAVEIIPRPPDCEKTTEVLIRWDFTTCSKCLQFSSEKIKDCQGESHINRPLSSWWDGKCLPNLKVNYRTSKTMLKWSANIVIIGSK